MTPIPIEHAIYSNADSGGYRFLARSPGFQDDWLAEAERICTGFGERPAGVACPASVFAQPFSLHHVAIVQVADQGHDDAGRPGALGFYLLVVPRRAYGDLMGDPFQIADRYPPPWEARGDMPTLSWPAAPLPARTVAEVQKVLRNGNSATLLGGAQALVDGGKLVFERSAPDNELLRNLWLLLPDTTRSHLWPASFAFGNALRFDCLAVPRADEMTYTSYRNEVQAGDYPEGRYELHLQIAVESGDQRELDALFARHSSSQILKLVVMLLVVVGVLALVMRMLTTQPRPRPTPTQVVSTYRTVPHLEADYPKMSTPLRLQVAQMLHDLAHDLGVPAHGPKPTVETLLEEIDKRLGTPDPKRDPGPLKAQRPAERQLRVLLWKHDVSGFDDLRLNEAELVERLRNKLVPPKKANPPRD
ncbi:MAG: hypothetical protein K2R98_10065 [Gemmataceae bacterium]|nr:hypothetical protein [Gemmataceae bacterium]